MIKKSIKTSAASVTQWSTIPFHESTLYHCNKKKATEKIQKKFPSILCSLDKTHKVFSKTAFTCGDISFTSHVLIPPVIQTDGIHDKYKNISLSSENITDSPKKMLFFVFLYPVSGYGISESTRNVCETCTCMPPD